MIPPCRYCDGAGFTVPVTPCPRCEGSQLDEAWQIAIASDRPGFARIRIAYGAHAAARPLVDTEMVAEAAELLLTVLGSGNRRGLIIRDRRPPASKPNPDYQPDGHDIRLLPSDPAKTHAVRDEWRSECSCGWASPPDAGQGPAAEHWLAHMRDVAEREGATDGRLG